MPVKYTEEKEGRIAYENTILNIMNKINKNCQHGRFISAYLAMRDLFNSLIPRHRGAWLTKIDELNLYNGGRTTRSKATRMLNPKRPYDHYLEPDLYHKNWMEIKRAWVAAAHSPLKLFFISREIDVGHEKRPR